MKTTFNYDSKINLFILKNFTKKRIGKKFKLKKIENIMIEITSQSNNMWINKSGNIYHKREKLIEKPCKSMIFFTSLFKVSFWKQRNFEIELNDSYNNDK